MTASLWRLFLAIGARAWGWAAAGRRLFGSVGASATEVVKSRRRLTAVRSGAIRDRGWATGVA